ncbi:genetransfer agent (GTA) ORFG10 [alpha proteobacterium U9-1i]|nr:genetransfer agent (GTA) ORFG10 [alpha proteobacterium U9-1i]
MPVVRNAARGETVLDINGAPRRLCVTLGALAELEAAFDVSSLSELGDRLSHLTPSDLIHVLAALTAGGGAPMSAGELASAQIDTRAAANAVAEAFQLAFSEDA